MNFIVFVLNICVGLVISAIMIIYPALTRKSFLFGVEIPMEAQSAPGSAAIKKRYIMYCVYGGVALLAMMIYQYVLYPDFTLIAGLYYPFLYVALHTALYVSCWKRSARLKEDMGWTVPAKAFAETKSSHTRGTLADFPWLWYIISLIIILFGIIATLIAYPGLPDRIPTHFDINMRPDAWSDKSLLTAMTLPLINLATFALMWLTGVMVVRARLQIDQERPALSFAQHKAYRARMGHSTGFLTLGLAITLTLTGFLSIWPEFYIPFWLVLALPFIASAPLMYYTIASGQGGCRIKIDPRELLFVADADTRGAPLAAGAMPRDCDKYWILGMFYYNPDDPAYIVENRFGNKLGFNYARLPVKAGVSVLALSMVITYAWITDILLAAM